MIRIALMTALAAAPLLGSSPAGAQTADDIRAAFDDLRQLAEGRAAIEMDDVTCSHMDCLGFIGDAIVHLRWPQGGWLRVTLEPLSLADTGPFLDSAIAGISYMTGAGEPEAEGLLLRGLHELESHERASGDIAGANLDFRRNADGLPVVDISRRAPL